MSIIGSSWKDDDNKDDYSSGMLGSKWKSEDDQGSYVERYNRATGNSFCGTDAELMRRIESSLESPSILSKEERRKLRDIQQDYSRNNQ